MATEPKNVAENETRRRPDATPLVDTVEALANAAPVLAALFVHGPSPAAVFDARGRCVLVNPAYRSLFGAVPPPEYDLRRDELLAALGLRTLFESAFEGASGTTPVFWYDPRELPHVKVREAKRVALECTYFPLPDPAGRIEHIGVTYRDVTAELTARAETAAERDRLRAILEQSGEGIVAADADGTIQIFNAQAQRQHGTARVGVTAADWAAAYGLERLDGEPLPLSESPLQRALRGERVEGAIWRVRRPDGEIRVLEGTATPVHANGDISGAVAITRDITERRRSENELRLHSQVLASMTEGVCVADPGGRILYTNDALDQMFGYPRGALVGERVTALSAEPVEPENDRVRAITEALRRSGAWAGEWENRRRNGAFFRTRAHATRVELDGREHWVLVLEDITAQVQARDEAARLADELRRSEDHYRATVELNPQITWTAAPDGSITTFSERLTELTGRPVPEALGTGWVRFVAEDGARMMEAWQRATRTGEPYDIEHRIQLADGSLRWMRSRASPRRDGSGRIVGWYGWTEDIHDRKLAQAALQEGERQQREMVENLPELAWSARADGFIDFFNRRWFEYTGTTPEQMEGWGWASVHDPERLPEVLAFWRRTIESGEPGEMEFPLRGADAVFRWFLTRVRPLRASDGRVLRWIGTNTNVDEHRRQEVQLRQAIRARDTFISIAGHELNTPLTALGLKLQGLARALRSEPFPTLEERIRRDLQSIERQAKRLGALVSGMLDVSRLTTGRLELALETSDLSELAREVVGTLGPEAERVGSSLDFAAAGPVHGAWDPLRVMQIVSNLVANALRYGEGRPVSVHVSERDGMAVIAVRDRGRGISPEDQARIFEKYERAASERHYGGLGLGLFVVRELVTAMGGTIAVASSLGEGSVFTVELPIRESADPE